MKNDEKRIPKPGIIYPYEGQIFYLLNEKGELKRAKVKCIYEDEEKETGKEKI